MNLKVSIYKDIIHLLKTTQIFKQLSFNTYECPTNQTPSTSRTNTLKHYIKKENVKNIFLEKYPHFQN